MTGIDVKKVSAHFHDILDEWEHSNNHYFLTGKAGTGKSTLLQLFRNTTQKKVVVLAPTGMAAIQIKGQTIHSFFQLAPRLLTPEKLSKPKNSKLISRLDTIIIDEVSMVRADLLDSIDHLLRLATGKPLPFGGIQMIFIGDILQLPPVVSSVEEKQWLQNKYESPYFFAAHVLESLDIFRIELNEVFRQKDFEFVQILDAIRNGQNLEDALVAINSRVNVDLGPKVIAITLCSINAHAEAINNKRMMELGGHEKVFAAEVTGNLPPKQLPVDQILRLKPGAQVMFVKNDTKGRYVNGTLGKVIEITKNKVFVLPDKGIPETDLIEVESTTWEMVKYKLSGEDANSIDVEVTGSIKQLPLKLAWAITIHKSQGQSYDYVKIDLGRGAFAYGQSYVALSRCRSLHGISLTRPIREEDILIDPTVIDFIHSRKWS